MKDYVLERIPKNAGLICILESGKCLYIKDAEIRKDAFKWAQSEMFKLAKLGAMRIFNLKNNIKKLSLKNIKVNP